MQTSLTYVRSGAHEKETQSAFSCRCTNNEEKYEHYNTMTHFHLKIIIIILILNKINRFILTVVAIYERSNTCALSADAMHMHTVTQSKVSILYHTCKRVIIV